MSELDQSEMEKMVEEVLDEIENTDKQEENDEQKQEENDELITLYIKTPDGHDLNMQLSATESVQDVRSYLLEVPETCYVTCYHLELNGKVVSDYLDLSEVEELENESVLYMVEDEYNEHQAIFHVTRLKEILALSGKENDSIFQEFVSNDDVRFEGLKKLDGTVEPLLVNFFPQVTINIKCLNKIAHSGWNPPPPHRKLIGDYFYLEVDLLEESPITITSWAKGFFINQSKNNNFNPIPKDKKFKSHSLVQLLRAVSPSFADNFNVLVSKYISPTSVDSLPPPFPRYNWLAKLEPHEYDPSRAENSLLQFSNVDYHIQGHSREWNDDYQSYKESPSNDGYERDRNIYKHYCDFVDFATKGAIEIVRGNIPPINPMEDNKAHMYIFNNIFFSYAMDGRDNYKDIGGDMAAYKSASNDLLGVQLYNRVDVKGLYTLATVIIDYIGYRLVAQSIIPGLFSEKNTEENEMKLAYGSLDQKTISVNEDFHALMEEAAKKLHIKVHKVQDEEGKTYSIASHVEVKGIVGTDNRKYILDLTHPTPRDSNYPEIEHSTAILRPELIELYLLSLREKARTQKIKEWNKKVEERKLKKEQENKEKEEKKDEVKEENKEENTEEKKEVEEKKEEVQEEEFSLDIPAPEVYFNTDLFKKTKTIYDDVNEMEQDKKLIEEVSAYLVNYLIPKLVLDAQMSLVVPVDSDSLKNTFHRLGINLRYLGRVTALALNRSNQLWELCIMEMVSRTFKHLFNENIRECTSSNLPNAVVHLLNTYFGRYTNSTEGSRSGILNEGKKEVKEENTESVQGKKSNSLFNLNHNDLWKTIRTRIQQKYGFELPEMIPIALFHIPMLRSICKRCGIQLKARDYDLTKEKPFILDDIISLYPVLKLAIPKTQHGENLLEAGKSFMIQGRIDYAIDYLPEALDILHQVYGPMSQETAQCLTCLAKVLFDMGNFVQAVEHQEKAVIINERVLGLDHYDTIQSYTTLAIYRLEKEEAPVPSVINFMKRSLYLSYVIGGHNNPEITPLIINTGTMLQYSGKLEEAIVYFTQALENTIKIYGDKHLETAAIYYHISVAYTLIQNYREALRMEQKNFEILSEIFDTKDKRVIESSARMKQLTKHALSEAKKSMNQEKKGRIKQNLKFPLQSQSQNPTFDQSGIFESGFLLNQTKGARKKHQVRVQRVDKDPQPEPKVQQPKNQKKQNNQNNNQQNETDQTNNQKKQPNNQKKQPNNQQKQQKQPNNQQKQPNNQQKQTTNGSHKKQQNNQQQNQSKQNNQPKTEINQEDNTQPEKQQNTNNNQTNNRGGRGRGGRGNKRGGKGR